MTWIRTKEVCYGTQVVSALCHFRPGSIWPWVISAFCLRLKRRNSKVYILKRKRNATLSKTVVSFFSSTHSASDNVIAKYRYLPCIQHQNQTAVTYGWRAATRNVRQPPFLKSQSSKIVPILRKNVLNQYRFLKAKG